LSKILSIGTAVPQYGHRQDDILSFMQRVYALDEAGKRKLKFLYHQGGIQTRYSVIPDYSLSTNEWTFFSPTENLEPFPNLEKRMQKFNECAADLSLQAIKNCLNDFPKTEITHLITVSCTGMSAPGLDLALTDLLGLPGSTVRISINFMGCYAAIQALRVANAFCTADKKANVLIVCTELCTLHFQKENTPDNITSSLLFADGSAAVLIGGHDNADGLRIHHFYSSVDATGKKDMAWELSSTGFLMTLSGYVPDLIEKDFGELVNQALLSTGITKDEIEHWCIHPGGKKILEAVHHSLGFTNGQLQKSYEVLKDYGNMSSASILFVLQKILKSGEVHKSDKIFGAAFGPGLTMETFILTA
jgi:predicted naringenin-chalcone synthase